MERLTGADAAFLELETPSMHMHTLKVAVIDPSSAPGGYTFERVRELLAERIHLLPPFHRRVLRMPLGVTHPVWVEDVDFDVDRHLRRRAVHTPGDTRALSDLVADVAAMPLPHDRPLWELTVVEGLEGGRIGFIAKIHHALADGSAAVALLTNVLDGGAAEAPGPVPSPSRQEVFRYRVRALFRALLVFPSLLLRALRGRWLLARHRRARGPRSTGPFAAPQAVWNRPLTPRRDFATSDVDLESILDVKHRTGTTVNDVVLATVGGALRRYLGPRGLLPARSLVASVPIGTDRDHGPHLWGNRVSSLFVSLCTSEPDPATRLAAVNERTEAGKRELSIRGITMLEEWQDVLPARLYASGVRMGSRFLLRVMRRPPVNLVVSCVAGPRERVTIGGAGLDELYSVGPILDGIALNVTSWSYAGRMWFGVLGCPDLGVDVHALADAIPVALVELFEATLQEDRQSGATPGPSKVRYA